MASHEQVHAHSANPLASGTPSPTSSHSTPPTVHSVPADDDIWGTPPHSPVFAEAGLQSYIPSDIPRIRTTHTTAGYRDGVAAARDAAVQPGFDEGYLLGAAIGVRAGYLIGVMEGIVAGVEDLSAERTEPLQLELKAVKDELAVEKLLGQEWVEQDGTWKWKVEKATSDDQEEDATIVTVANAHPTIQKWSARVENYMRAADLRRGDGMRSKAQEV